MGGSEGEGEAGVPLIREPRYDAGQDPKTPGLIPEPKAGA